MQAGEPSKNKRNRMISRNQQNFYLAQFNYFIGVCGLARMISHELIAMLLSFLMLQCQHGAHNKLC